MKKLGTLGILARESMIDIIRLVAPETPRYKHFDFVYLEEMFEDSFEQINKVVDNIDVFICGHGHRQLLSKWYPNKPIVVIKPLYFDVMMAIQEASQIDETVNIIDTQKLEEIDDAVKLFGNNINIAHYKFNNDADLKKIFVDIKKNGGRSVVGGTLVYDLAPLYGLKAFYYHSEKSVKQAIVDAINLVLLKREQKIYSENVNKIIDLSNVGLMVIDNNQKVQYINSNALKILERSRDNTIGIDAQEILQNINLDSSEEQSKVIEINGKQILCDAIISDEDNLVYRFQEVDQVEKVSYNIRRQMLNKPATAKYNFDNIIGRGLRSTIEIANSYAMSSDANVLIIGATGTGKELFASSIHNNSNRAQEPFIPVNCAALPENLLESELFGYEAGAFTGAKRSGKRGLIELAHKGTLFLDEIGEMPIALQAKMLRVIQEKEVLHIGGETQIPVDVRIISATNANLMKGISNRTFRPDLYYRLSTLVLEIPELAKRRSDIPELIEYYLQDSSMPDITKQIISDVICQYWSEYTWPGNVRELQNVLERVVTYIRYTSKENLPTKAMYKDLFSFLQSASVNKGEIPITINYTKVGKSNTKISEEIIKETLASVDGNKTKAAELLGISRSTLWRYLKE